MRIVHLTDLHLRYHLPGTSPIAKRQSRRMPELLARAVEQIQALAPDLLVITGDLLDYPESYQADPRFRALAREDLRLIEAHLTPLSCEKILIMGNHDPQPLGEDINAVFCTTVSGHEIVAFQDWEDAHHVPHRQGVAWAGFLAALERKSCPQIHVQHYVVWPRLDQGYPHTYAEAETMRQYIAANGHVRLVLSGHYHEGLAPFQHGNTWYAIAPAFCEAPFRFWVYDLTENALTWHERQVEPWHN